jgi:hypothetical protein
MTEPTDRAPSASPEGAPPTPPFICCSHCEHQSGYVHNGGCADTFCTGYDERTPNGEMFDTSWDDGEPEPEPAGATSAWEHHYD